MSKQKRFCIFIDEKKRNVGVIEIMNIQFVKLILNLENP